MINLFGLEIILFLLQPSCHHIFNISHSLFVIFHIFHAKNLHQDYVKTTMGSLSETAPPGSWLDKPALSSINIKLIILLLVG